MARPDQSSRHALPWVSCRSCRRRPAGDRPPRSGLSRPSALLQDVSPTLPQHDGRGLRLQRGDASTAAARPPQIGLQFLLQLGNPDPGLFFQFHQGLPSPHRRAACRGPDLGTVGDDLVQCDQAFLHQSRQTACQKAIEELAALQTELRQHRVVHPDPAADPAIDRMMLAQPRQRAGRPNPVGCRIQPKRKQNARVGRRPTRYLATRLDAIVERLKVQAFHEGPHRSYRVVVNHQALKIDQLKTSLPTFRFRIRMSITCSESIHAMNHAAAPKK